MSRFVLGTVQFGTFYGVNSKRKPSEEEVFQILDVSHDNAIKTLDTAPAYGEAEEIIGKYQERRKKSFKINSKFSVSDSCSLKESLNKSLHKLKNRKLNAYFFHRFEDMAGKSNLIRELKELKADGMIDQAGISVYTNDQFDRSIDEPVIDVIQFPFNLLDNSSKREKLILSAEKAGKKLQARSVFLQGLFLKELNSLPVFLQPLKKYLEKIRSIASENGISVYELSLSYVLSMQKINEIVIGVDNKEQLQSNLSIAHKSLNASVCNQISSIEVTEEALLYPYNWK